MRASTFTTYINAQIDPGMEAAFDRQTKAATASFATITQSAQAATRATAGLISGKGTAGIQTVNRALESQSRAARAVTTSAAAQERQAARTEQSLRREATQAARTAQAHTGLARNLNATATAFGVVEGRMSPLAGRLITVSRAAEQLSGLQLGLAGVGATLFALGRAGNEYATLAARLRPFYASQSQANRAMEDVIGIAKRSRTALEPVVEIYSRLKSNLSSLGISDSQIGRLTEFASKAATLSGGTRQAREGALVQFSQALGANFRGSGQEFASLQEGAPQLLKLLADNFRKADGSIGITIANLRKLAEEGKLTTAQIAEAADRARPALERMFAALPKTLGTSATEFGTALTVMVGKFDQNVGLTNTLAQSLSLVAEHLRVITGLIVGAGAAFAGIKAGTLVLGLAAAAKQTVVMHGAVTQLGVRRAAVAAASQAQHAREVAALKAEQAQIQANIATLTRQRAVAQGDIRRATAVGGVGGSDRRVAAAHAEEMRAVRALSGERQRAGVVAAALTAANGRLATSTTAAAATAQAAATRVGFFTSAGTKLRGVLGNLVSFLGGPYAVAFGLATTAVFLLATAQSASEKAADAMAESQARLAGFIDATTGKIIEQSNALLTKQRIEQTEKVLEARKVSANSRQNLAIYGNAQITPQAARDAIGRYNAGQISANDLSLEIAKIRTTSANQRAALGSIQNIIGNITVQARTAEQERAALLALYGNEAAGRAASAGKGVTLAPRVATPRTSAQIEAAAKADAARTGVERARADLAKVRADKDSIIATQGEEAYQRQLTDSLIAVQSATEATKGLASARTRATKAARDAVQDGKDLAASKRDASLLNLEKQKPLMSQEAYLQTRQLILKTYDDEVNRLDASAAASNRAAGQMIADAKKVAEQAAAAAEKRRDILSSYDTAPKAVDRALDQIDDLQDFVDSAVDGVAFLGKTKAEIAEISKMNPLGTGIYTQEMADADAQRIEQGVRKPLDDANREAERGVQIANLMLQGREAEAEALRRAFDFHERIGKITADDYSQILANVRQEERINDLLASRSRITSLITGSVDAARDSFEQLLTDLPNGAGNAAKNFLQGFMQRFNQINARMLTEKLFAGTDEKVRAMLTGKADVDGALRQYIETLDTTETATEHAATAVEKFAARVEAVTNKLAGVESGPGSTSVGFNATNVGAVVANQLGGGALTAGIVGIAATVGAKAANDNGIPESTGQDIVVTAAKTQRQLTTLIQKQRPMSTVEAFNAIGSGVGKNLDSTFDKIFRPKAAKAAADAESMGGIIAPGSKLSPSTFFTKMGDKIGTAMQGAATGAMVNSIDKTLGISKALGLKSSKTGAQVGGAIGGLTGIPGGQIIGSIIGSVVGGLFKKTKSGAATVSVDSTGQLVTGEAFGNSKAMKKSASQAGNAVADGLTNIAEQLGATIAGNANITIGQRDGKWRVNTMGTSLKVKKGAVDFGKDGAEDAVEYAIQYAIENAVLTGISQASITILKSGQDLEKAVAKAGVIESIPKRLMQLQDPVRYAITNLNAEFSKMISYLKEGGATAQQFADAQKLYDLERAEAIKQATQEASEAISAFLQEMTSGTSSPYSKRTTYTNATTELDKFKADIAGGKAVDQQALLTASRNFQDASRALYGSTSSFFADFDMLKSLLEKARSNLGSTPITDPSTLPASPFADAAVQAAIASLQGATTTATQNQTAALSAKLDEVVRAVTRLYLPTSGTSAIASLPGFANAA